MSLALRLAPEANHASLRCLLLAAAVVCPREATASWPSDPLVNVPVCTAANFQQGPTIATDRSGGAIITWGDLRDGVSSDIYAQRVLASGACDPAWPVNGRALCTATGNQLNSQVAPDGLGGALVVWQDNRGGAGNDIYSQHVLSNGAVDPTWPADGVAVCPATGDQILPKIVGDGSGGVLVAWYDSRSGADRDVYAHHVLASGTTDPAWPVNGRALCSAAGDQTNPRLVSDGVGGAIVVWQDARAGAQSDIYTQHVLANGVVDPSWPVDGLPVCTATGSQQVPEVASDGSGGALVAWQDFRTLSTADVYSAHVLASGTVDPTWPVDGRALCVAGGEQSAIAIAASSPGEAIVAWKDGRSGTSFDIYVQRASGPAGPGWPVDGRAVCTATGDQRNPVVAADGSGGAVVSWHDKRVDAGNIYAQHVLASGFVDPVWPTDGSALCIAVNQQQEPRILADGSGGAIVTWMDMRGAGGFNDVYAQRVQANGVLGGTVLDVPSDLLPGLALDPISPNPWRGGALSVSLSIPSADETSLELLDIAGRRVAQSDVASLGPGRHTVELVAARRLACGIYFVRLRQGDRVRSTRVAVLD